MPQSDIADRLRVKRVAPIDQCEKIPLSAGIPNHCGDEGGSSGADMRADQFGYAAFAKTAADGHIEVGQTSGQGGGRSRGGSWESFCQKRAQIDNFPAAS